MENEIYKLSPSSSSNQKKIDIKIKDKVNFLLFLILICALINTFLFLKIFNLNHRIDIYESSLKNFNEIRKKCEEKLKNYNENISFYKEMLQLYVDNKTQFYLKGREFIMKKNGKIYKDSSINSLQDKLNWLLIHDNPERKANLVDKILLHEYSIEKFGKDICVPILKTYNSVDEIDFDQLPDKFALKCNHGSGMNILSKWIKLNSGLFGFECQYLRVKRKIFVEEYLSDNNN